MLTMCRPESKFRLMALPSLREARADPTDQRVSEVAKKTFFRIMEAWGVSNEQAQVLLGSPSRSTYYAWKKGEGGNLSRDTLERVSYVLGIYQALQVLFPEAARADGWVSTPNLAFGGRSALDRMTAGNLSDLHAVRAYLDHARGGGS